MKKSIIIFVLFVLGLTFFASPVVRGKNTNEEIINKAQLEIVYKTAEYLWLSTEGGSPDNKTFLDITSKNDKAKIGDFISEYFAIKGNKDFLNAILLKGEYRTITHGSYNFAIKNYDAISGEESSLENYKKSIETVLLNNDSTRKEDDDFKKLRTEFEKILVNAADMSKPISGESLGSVDESKTEADIEPKTNIIIPEIKLLPDNFKLINKNEATIVVEFTKGEGSWVCKYDENKIIVTNDYKNNKIRIIRKPLVSGVTAVLTVCPIVAGVDIGDMYCKTCTITIKPKPIDVTDVRFIDPPEEILEDSTIKLKFEITPDKAIFKKIELITDPEKIISLEGEIDVGKNELKIKGELSGREVTLWFKVTKSDDSVKEFSNNKIIISVTAKQKEEDDQVDNNAVEEIGENLDKDVNSDETKNQKNDDTEVRQNTANENKPKNNDNGPKNYLNYVFILLTIIIFLLSLFTYVFLKAKKIDKAQEKEIQEVNSNYVKLDNENNDLKNELTIAEKRNVSLDEENKGLRDEIHQLKFPVKVTQPTIQKAVPLAPPPPPDPIKHALFPDSPEGFSISRLQENEGRATIYRIIVRGDNNAVFRISTNPSIQKKALENTSRLLETACDFSNSPNDGNLIENQEDGSLIKSGSMWKIVKKAKIKFV